MDTTDVAAIVTGGASGLGGATVRKLAAGGARVIGIDLPSAVEDAEKLDNVEYVGADVTDPDQVATAVEAATSTGLPLRVVVNCAGIGTAGRVLSKKGPHDLKVFQQVIGVNLVGTFNVMRLAVRGHRRDRAARRTGRAASSSTPRPSPPSRGRSARSPTRRRRAAWSA